MTKEDGCPGRIPVMSDLPALIIVICIGVVMSLLCLFFVIRVQFCIRPAVLRKIKKVELSNRAQVSKKQDGDTIGRHFAGSGFVGHPTLLAMNCPRFIVVALSLFSVSGYPIPFLGSIATYVPGLQNAPMWNQFTKGSEESQNEMVQAGERLLSHALQITTDDDEAKVAHVEGMIGSFSDLVIHSPDFAKMVNVSLLTKQQIELLVNEQFDLLDKMFPGFIKERGRGRNVLEKITENMARAAMDLKKGNRVANVSSVLIPLEKLPRKLIDQAFNGDRLWSLNREESEAIRARQDYYLGVLSGAIHTDQDGTAVKAGEEPDTEFIKRLVEKMPRNIDFMDLPMDIVKKLLNGELPQLNTLPKKLQEFFKTNLDFFIMALGDKINMTDVEALPTFERIELPTYEPYDLSKLENGVMKLTDKKSNNVWVFVAMFLFLLSCPPQRTHFSFVVTAGIAGVLTVVFAFIVIQIRFCVRPALLRKIKKVQLEIMAEAKMSKKQQEETVTVTVDGPTN
ncbi:hypothetical protein QR680_006745 [Steinernema hermaphroditum]|uniref:Uncharacterized protein n=1 Tax=Steinernema hermaphroditum TaxID=289476 RepID=A0AA39HXZ1_9BILA|nr:hypothetical protein QR680_006745 [Steinernema hermaphroditum]